MTDRPAFSPPGDLLGVTETLEARGFQAWAVGGAIRNALLGHTRTDWDVATDARPEDVRRAFRRTLPIGIEHGTVGVLAPDGMLFQVTTFRRDIETDGRHAVVEFADSIQEDLARRDFTINAMAWRPATDEFVDPMGGRADLERRVLRAVGDAAQRMAEDYLRVLRGLRFAGRFALDVEPGTWDALVAGVGGTATLSAERVREELEKVLAFVHPSYPSSALGLYGEVGVLEIWYPEIAPARRDPRWKLNLAAVDSIPPTRSLLRLVRWILAPGVAELIDDSAAAGSAAVDSEATDSAAAAGSEAAAELRAECGQAILSRLRYSNADTRRAVHLLRHYHPLVGPLDSAAQIRSWLSEVGAASARDLFRLHFAGAKVADAKEKMGYLGHAWRRVHEELLASPPLRLADLAIGGVELLRMGVEPGPAVGILLAELHARVLEDPELNHAEKLARLARELIELGGLAAGGGGSGGYMEPRDG
ncbi:MAG: CCA tRNA nucleotidyltransferase [Gemmatimonadota bacterium]